MKYKAYKLKFSTGVHFGKGTLEDTAYAFCADTLFSALCIEAVKDSTERLERLVQTAKAGKMLLSDARTMYQSRCVKLYIHRKIQGILQKRNCIKK